MSDIDPTAPAKPRRAMRWLLIASLGLNLLVIGAVVGAIVSGGPRRDAPPSERKISAPYVAAFSKEDKRAMRREMRGRHAARADLIEQNKADYAAFIKTLRAESFDADAARAVMNRQMERSSQTVALGRQIALERIAAMTAQERMAYADRLEERVAQFGKKGVKRFGKPGKPGKSDE